MKQELQKDKEWAEVEGSKAEDTCSECSCTELRGVMVADGRCAGWGPFDNSPVNIRKDESFLFSGLASESVAHLSRLG